MLHQLTEHEYMSFIWAEISYFAKWYEQITPDQQQKVKK